MSIVDTYIDALTQGRCKPIQYSDRGKFGDLWSDTWVKLADNEASSRIVIVWDGAPTDHKLLVAHLTPLDWALAASLGLLNGGIEAGTTHWSLHIVDLSFGAYRNADVWSVQHAASLLDAMPWVRLYGPLQLKRRAYDPRRFAPVIGGVWADVPTMAECLRNRRESLRHDLQRLTQSWQGSIQRSDDHHDLNNLVAPALLSREYTKGGDDVALRAFARKCRWIGAASVDGPDYGRMAQDVQTALAGLPERGDVHVTLVDDTADWGALVKQWLGESQELVFETHTSPNSLVELLRRREPEEFRHRDYSRSVWNAAATGAVDEVLIWDLRLFGKGDATPTEDRRTKERCFYSQLVEAIRRCKLVGATDLAWPGFTSEEIDEIEKWCTSGPDEPPEAALTLAPRCMALLSPTTPIILLSTTGRRSLMEQLKSHQNVFTGLEKPRPLDQFANDIDHLSAQWERAWNHATRLIAVRRRLRDIEHTEVMLRPTRHVPQVVSNQAPYVEIYVDESGTRGQQVGGVIAIFTGKDVGRCTADTFDDILFESGVCYYDPLVRTTDPQISIKSKGEHCAEEVTAAIKRFNNKDRHVELFRFAMSFVPQPQQDRDEPIRRVGDFQYFQTAATALELLLYDAIPGVLHHKKFTAAIYVATRHLGDKEQSDLQKIIRDFGYDRLIGEQRLQSVGGNSVLPVLARVMSERKTVDRFFVDRALGITLKYEKWNYKPTLPNRFLCRRQGCEAVSLTTATALWNCYDVRRHAIVDWTGYRSYRPAEESGKCAEGQSHQWVPDFRALHYIADEVVTSDRAAAYAECISSEPPGFLDGDDRQMRDLLLASRLIDQGETVLALMRALTAVDQEATVGLSSIRQRLLAKLLPVALKLRGEDLFKIAAALPAGIDVRIRGGEALREIADSIAVERTHDGEPDGQVRGSPARRRPPQPPGGPANCRILVFAHFFGDRFEKGAPTEFIDAVAAIGLSRFTCEKWHNHEGMIVGFFDGDLQSDEWLAVASAVDDGRARYRQQSIMMQQMLAALAAAR